MSSGNGRPPSPGPSDGTADRLERDLERLAVPRRSLFEDGGDAAPEGLRGPRRANPLSVPVGAVRMASGLIALLVAASAGRVLAGEPGALAGVLVATACILAACLAISLAAWSARTWELTNEGVSLRWGLGWGPFARHSLTVPYGHIHTVSMRSSLFERVFGLMTLDLDTGAAASEGDASKIGGLRAGEAEALRAELFRRRAASLATGDEEVWLAGAPCHDGRPIATFSLSRRELLLAAASRMSAASQAVALTVLLARGVETLIEWGLLDLVGRGDELLASAGAMLVPIVAGFVVLVLAAGAVVSFAVNLVRYAGYRVERYADRVVVEHGLLARSSRTLAAERVQYVVVRQGLIRQLMGYAEVLAVVVAAPGEPGGEPSGSVLLHPFVRLADADAFLAEVLPSYAGVVGGASLSGLPPVARRRALVRAVVWWPFSVAFVVAALWFSGLAGVLGRAGWLLRPLLAVGVVLSIVALVALVTDALRAWEAARYGRSDGALVLVTGGLTRLTVVAPRSRLQHATVSASPFQRRAGLATLTVRTAASSSDGLRIRDLPADAADELLGWFRPRRP